MSEWTIPRDHVGLSPSHPFIYHGSYSESRASEVYTKPMCISEKQVKHSKPRQSKGRKITRQFSKIPGPRNPGRQPPLKHTSVSVPGRRVPRPRGALRPSFRDATDLRFRTRYCTPGQGTRGSLPCMSEPLCFRSEGLLPLHAWHDPEAANPEIVCTEVPVVV